MVIGTTRDLRKVDARYNNIEANSCAGRRASSPLSAGSVAMDLFVGMEEIGVYNISTTALISPHFRYCVFDTLELYTNFTNSYGTGRENNIIIKYQIYQNPNLPPVGITYILY